MIVNLESKPYQVNHYFVGDILKEGESYKYTLEIMDVFGSESQQDYMINWHSFPPDIQECEKLILELYKEQQTI